MKRVLAIGSTYDLPELHIFAGLVRHGIVIDAIVSKKSKLADHLSNAGIGVKILDFAGRIDPFAIVKLRGIIRSGNYDILHCLTARGLANALIASWGLKIKLIAYRGTSGRDSRWSIGSWMSFLNPGVDKIICVSNAVRDFMSRMVAPGKLVTIYKGHDVAWYDHIKPKQDLKEFGIPENAFVVACLANLRPVKGVKYLIDALKFIPKDLPIHVLLIGRQDRTIEIFDNRLHLAGFQSDAISILKSCQAFVMPSIAREGLPKAMMEALAIGLPTIVTNVGGMPEVVQDGVNGLVVAPRDASALAIAMIRVCKDRELATTLSKAARVSIVDSFNISESIERVLAVYFELS